QAVAYPRFCTDGEICIGAYLNPTGAGITHHVEEAGMQHWLAQALQVQFFHGGKLIHELTKRFIAHERCGPAGCTVSAKLNRAHTAPEVALPYRLDLDEFR